MLVNAQKLAGMAWAKANPPPLGDFHADARTAIVQAPDYFVWWYTAKSIGLGVAVGLIGFLIGRATARK